jgi:hypothetical protein
MKARLMQVIRLAMAMWARKPMVVPTPVQEEEEAWGDYSVECDCCRREFVPTPASFVECTVAIDPEWRAEIGTEPTAEQITLVCQRMNIGTMQAWRVIRRGVLHGVPRAFCVLCRLRAGVRKRNQTGGGR